MFFCLGSQSMVAELNVSRDSTLGSQIFTTCSLLKTCLSFTVLNHFNVLRQQHQHKQLMLIYNTSISVLSKLYPNFVLVYKIYIATTGWISAFMWQAIYQWIFKVSFCSEVLWIQSCRNDLLMLNIHSGTRMPSYPQPWPSENTMDSSFHVTLWAYGLLQKKDTLMYY